MYVLTSQNYARPKRVYTFRKANSVIMHNIESFRVFLIGSCERRNYNQNQNKSMVAHVHRSNDLKVKSVFLIPYGNLFIL